MDIDGGESDGIYYMGSIDVVSARTGEMLKRYRFIYVDKNDEGKRTEVMFMDKLHFIIRTKQDLKEAVDGLGFLPLFELLDREAPVLSKDLKRRGNYIKGGKKGFETMITRLQYECYAVISDFIYAKDRHGQEYGWGIAQYSTPEKFMGESFAETVYKRTPKESHQRILEHLKSLMPGIEQKKIEKKLI